MKRAIQLALVVAVCLVALAQASVIYWGPAKRLCDDDKSWTSGNNTWAVTGTGDTAEAVFVRRISNVTSVWFARSTNRGGQWSDPTQISGLEPSITIDSASSPSIVKLNTNAHGEQLVVAYLAWRSKKTGPFTETSYVFCRGSTNGGLDWRTTARCTSSLYRLTQVSAAAADADGDWLPHFELAWRLPGNGGDYLFNRRGHLSSGNVDFDGDPIQFVNYVSGAGAPSIYTTPWLHAGCAWQEYDVNAPGEAYDRRNGNYWSWPDVMLQIGGVSGRTDYGYPSISHTILQGGTKMQELVAYNVRPGNVTNPPQRIGSAHRELTLDENHAVTDSSPSWSCPNELYLGYNLDSLFRPNVWSSGDTFYMLFTGFPHEIDSRKVYCTATTNGGTSWMLNDFLDAADSASICVSMGNGYCVYTHSGTTYHRALARFGRVAYSPLEVPPPEAQDGSGNGRRLAREPGTGVLHRAYVVEDYINYERSDDNGATWGYQDAPDWGTNPTIALRSGNPTIAYLRNDTVLSATLNSDSEWTIRTLFAGSSTLVPGAPSLAMFSSGTGRSGNICFPVYYATAHSKIIYIQFDTTGTLEQNTVDDFAGSFADSSSCITVASVDTAEVVYSHGDSIYMRQLVYPPTDYSPPPDTWPGSSLVSTEPDPVAMHPFCEKIGSRLWVTYTLRYVDGGQTYWVIKEVSCSDAATPIKWEGLSEASDVNTYPTDYPCLSTSRVVAWAESSGTHWVIKADIGDSMQITLTNPDSNSKFVSLLADTAVQTTPSTSTTGVYYIWLQQLDGTAWSVPYASKQFLTSNADANVTRYNQGRKLVLSTDDTLSSVYRTTQGSIYYSKKKDGVEGWTSSLLRSTGQFPCLANDYLNRTWVADRDVNSVPPSQVIRCQNRAVGSSTWHDFQVYSVSTAGPATAKLGPPSIVACQNDSSNTGKSAAYIVFTVYTASPLKSTVVMAKVDTQSVVYVDTLHHVTTYGDSFPSIAAYPVAGPGYGLEVAWQYGTDVYVKKTTNSEHPEFLPKRAWSSNFNLTNTAAKSKHPQIAADDTVLVAWVEGDSGAILTKGQAPGSAYNAWDASGSVSACTDTCCDNPSIALGDSIIVTYQKKLSNTNLDVIARVNFHSNLNLSNSTTTSKYPHCLFHFHDGDPVISTVWTEELSANYAEVAYKRWQLGEEDGGGIQDYSIFDPNIRPALFAPAPNPFNGLTNIRYATNIRGMTRVSVMDITGRRVRNLQTMPQSPGIYNLTWNARDDRERQLPRGIYFVRLETTNYSEARKLILTE